MVRVTDPRLRQYKFEPREACLVAGVMIVHIDRWLQLGLRERVEELLEMNAEQQLWHLGSMPPLIVALGHRNWERLSSRQIVDMKGRVCCAPAEETPWQDAVLLHPVQSRRSGLGF